MSKDFRGADQLKKTIDEKSVKVAALEEELKKTRDSKSESGEVGEGCTVMQ